MLFCIWMGTAANQARAWRPQWLALLPICIIAVSLLHAANFYAPRTLSEPDCMYVHVLCNKTRLTQQNKTDSQSGIMYVVIIRMNIIKAHCNISPQPLRR